MDFLVYFLYLYLFVVLITILSHIFTDNYLKGFDNKVADNKFAWFKVWYKTQQRFDGCFRKRVLSRLQRPYVLVGFKAFLVELNGNERRSLLEKNAIAIANVARKMNNTTRAYFAYILCEIEYDKEYNTEVLASLMADFACGNSVHVRENALKALYHMENVKYISKSYLELSRRKITHSEKLLSDGLLSCVGKAENVAEYLMKYFEQLIDCYRDAVVTCLSRRNDHKYDSKLKELLMGNKLSIDLQCEVLRLIGKDKTQDNGEFIVDYCNTHDESLYWETLTVAVGVLGNFERTDRIADVLRNALTARNWYIRRNSASSLCKIGISDEEIAIVQNADDKYAKEALNYALSKDRGRHDLRNS